MKKFFGGLKKAIGILATVKDSPIGGLLIGSIPIVGSVIDVVDIVIAQAESEFKEPSSGAKKFEFAMKVLESHGPGMISAYEKATGKDVINEEAFGKAIQHMTQARVELANAFGKQAQ